MLKYLSLVLFSLYSCLTFAEDINYNLKMPKPANHYYHVEMELSGFQEKVLNVKMPIWAPGSYLAREFAKNVNLVKAFDENGDQLPLKQNTKRRRALKRLALA